MQPQPTVTVVVRRYGLETSPTVKGICAYFADRGTRCLIITDELLRERSFTIPGTELLIAVPHRWSTAREESAARWLKRVPFLRGRLLQRVREMFRIGREQRFRAALAATIPADSIIYCIEFHSLRSALASGIDPSSIVYVSLELEQQMLPYPAEECRRQLESCRGCIVQSQERAADLNRFLGSSIQFSLLPVSRIPAPGTPRKASERVSLVFSGYFARWSCLEETVSAFLSLHSPSVRSLMVQGHAVGTEEYYGTVQRMAATDDRITLTTDYFDDDAHLQFLRGFDIGLALYQPDSDIANWNNLVLSSGKIATYAWAGLAIITNIDAPMTKVPPFLFVPSITAEELGRCVELYAGDREQYHRASRELAERYYDLFARMRPIEERFHTRAAEAKG